MARDSVLAATLEEPGRYELRECPFPEPAPGCVLVRMEFSGICSTDKHTFQGFTTQYGDRKIQFPIIQGHENVGTIAAIGGDGRFRELRVRLFRSATVSSLEPRCPAASATTAATTSLTTAVKTRSTTEIS